MIDTIGMNLNDAINQLEKLNFEVETIELLSNKIPVYDCKLVVRQELKDNKVILTFSKFKQEI